MSYFSLPPVLETRSTKALSLLALERLSARSSNRSISFKMRDMSASGGTTRNKEGTEGNATTPLCTEERGRVASMPAVVFRPPPMSSQEPSIQSVLSDSDSSLVEDVPYEIREDHHVDVRGQQQSHRLSAIGLELDLRNSEILVPKDELHSPCSSQLEQLREEVARYLPAAEDMMSQAIIFAFSHDEGRNIQHPLECDGRSESFDLAYMVDAIWETLEFIKNQDDRWHSYDRTDRNVVFMQRHINNIVSQVRRNEISQVAAKHTIFCMAILLDMEHAAPLNTTIVTIFGLKRKTVPTDVREALGRFGDIEGIALSRKCPGFGICHFSSASAAKDAVSASKLDGIRILNACPRIMDLPLAGEMERIKARKKKGSFSPTSSSSEDEEVDNTTTTTTTTTATHFDDSTTEFVSVRPGSYPLRKSPGSRVENGTEVELQEYESYITRPRISRPKMYMESQKSNATVSTEACSMTDSDTCNGSSTLTLTQL